MPAYPRTRAARRGAGHAPSRPASTPQQPLTAVTSVKPAPAETPEADPYQAANRRFLATLGIATHGMSPISLYEAWLDWWLHLAVAPGKQAQIGVKAIEKWVRLRRYLGECALKGECAEPCIVPLA